MAMAEIGDEHDRVRATGGPMSRMADVVARLGVGVHVKMLTGYLSVALLLLVMAVLTLIVISRMSHQVEELTRLQGQLDKARLKTNLITAQLEYRALAFLTDDPSQNAKIDVAKQDFVAAINAAEVDSTGEKAEFFRRVRDTSESFDAVGRQGARQLRGGRPGRGP